MMSVVLLSKSDIREMFLVVNVFEAARQNVKLCLQEMEYWHCQEL
jgi:hypothetical protein